MTIAELRREVTVTAAGTVRHIAYTEGVIKAGLLRTWYLNTLTKQNNHVRELFQSTTMWHFKVLEIHHHHLLENMAFII